MDGLKDFTLTSVCEAFWVVKREKETLFMNRRTTSGLAIPTKGSYIYEQNGTGVVSDTKHPIFLPENAVYTLHCTSDDECMIVNFRLEKTPALLASFEIGDSGQLIETFERLRAGYESGVARPRMLSELYGLIAMITEGAQRPAESRRFRRIEKSVKYLEEHCCDPGITIERLAAISNVSEVTFRKYYTEETGIPPMRRIAEKRASRARYLLQTGKMTVGEVSEACGYSSIYYFSQAFKRETGVSPANYARQRREI